MGASWFSQKVEKRTSPVDGTGLFAMEKIHDGELVVVKGGHIFDRVVRDGLAETLGPAEIQIGDNLFIGPLTPEEREGSMMHLNHSCDPNVGIRGQICFHAMHVVEPGEELTFDYATGDDDDWTMICRCGSVRCRNKISGKDWKIAELQKRYEGWFSEYLQMKIERSAGVS
ncbi:SET domain-containing protein-lysine N-methyltransferase [Labrenzia sp. DG1229]|uniref:SET domain-containing protein n=1 Tax=Labrenzia sp. DG1229 TaxID=681847 RepID=UPI000491A715|nr:SET domain-containing protein-lysine N-methyltransferase [Labrenzia sp. DG1229]